MANRSHSRTYLEHLLNPPTQYAGTIGSRPVPMHRTSSVKSGAIASMDNYKPARSSALASTETGDEDGVIKNESDSEDGVKVVNKALSVSSLEDDGEEFGQPRYLRISTLTPLSRRSSAAESVASPQLAQSIQSIIEVLDNDEIDDEDRIERVRDLLAVKLKEAEGSAVTAARLDNIVLSLLHRHREDVRPTGTTFSIASSPSPSPFPASPRSRPRPAILRSGSSTTLTRPWTPTRPTTPTSVNYNSVENAVSPVGSPMAATLAATTGNGGGQGNLIDMLGSPRASPRLWPKALPTTAAAAASTPSRHGQSRPSSRSPSPGPPSIAGSPALNVSAVAFKPRSAALASGTPTKSATDSWNIKPSSKKPSVRPGDDSDEDEFSPFASQAAVPAPGAHHSSSASSMTPARQIQFHSRPVSGVSGNSSLMSMTTADSTSGGSYQGSTTSASLESTEDPRSLRFTGLEDDMSNLTMTPIDVLTSILYGIGAGTEAVNWSAEQVEEALERKNWDVDATLTAIMDGSINSLLSSAPPSTVVSRAIPTGPSAARSGVNVVSQEIFASQRAGLSVSPGGGESSPRTAFQRTPSAGASWQQPTQQPPASARAGLGRVCRFFLAGECRRADCRFSHDLNRALCRFWLKGQCLNGDDCSFLHDISLLDVPDSGAARVGQSALESPAPSDFDPMPAAEEFPELNLAPTGPRAQSGGRGGAQAGASVDPSRTRWAQAVQRKTNTPIGQVKQGDGFTTLHGKHGPMHGVPTGPRASQASQQSSSSSSRAMASRIPLRAPFLLPTLQTGRSAAQTYASYREACIALSEKRNRCLARAAEAWKAGNGAEARQWSREGQSLNKALQEESRTIARSIVRARHDELRERMAGDGGAHTGALEAATDERGARGLRGKVMGADLGVCLGVVPARSPMVPANLAKLSVEERTDVLMDCHLLHAGEAVDLIEEFLMGLEREQYRGLAMIAVGLGKHTSTETDRRRVGLAPAVRGFLESWQYPYAEHDGVMVVDPLSHL